MLSQQEQNNVVSRAEEIANSFLKSIDGSIISVRIRRIESETANSAISELTIQCGEFPKMSTWELLKKLISFFREHIAFPFSSNPDATLNEAEDLIDDIDRFTGPFDWFYYSVFLLGISQLGIENVWYTAVDLPIGRGDLSVSERYDQEQLEKMLVKWKIVARPQSNVNSFSSPTGLLLLKLACAKSIDSNLNFVIERVTKVKNKEKEEDVLRIYLVKELPLSHINIIEQRFHEQIFELETNIDDMTGEELGNILDEFSKRNDVLDVSAYALFMKKNRPAWCLRILTRHPKTVAERLLERTSTFGVRIQEVSRHVGDRRIRSEKVTVKGKKWKVRVKEKISRGRVVGWKLEYDDLQEIANKLAMPLLEVKREVEAQIIARRSENE